MDEQEVQQVLRNTSYTEFLKKFGGLPQDVIELFTKSTDGYWGVQPHSLSATEAMNAWLPGVHRLGSHAGDASGHEESEKVAMFPDGNASIARLLVQALIPGRDIRRVIRCDIRCERGSNGRAYRVGHIRL